MSEGVGTNSQTVMCMIPQSTVDVIIYTEVWKVVQTVLFVCVFDFQAPLL